jgi:glycosyltransferase involved in cell wall biosynthesis
VHVLLIHSAFSAPGDPGGTRHYELAQRLLPLGCRFTIVASELSYMTGRRLAAPRGLVTRENVGGVIVLRAGTLPTLHRRFALRLASFGSFMLTSAYVALRGEVPDVVMGTSPPHFQAVSAAVVAKLRRRPFLLEIRDLWVESAIEMGVLRQPALVGLSRVLERALYAAASHFVVNSPAYAAYLERKGVPPDKITLVPNGVEPAAFDPAARGQRLRTAWAVDDKVVVTYAGALGLLNDIPVILRAARRLADEPRVCFLLVGDGRERPALEAHARELGLTNVRFVGARPKADMPEVLAASDVCIATLLGIPTLQTTYPNKVFDYMAAGRPTVLAIGGVIRDVLERAGGGLAVPPGDDAALARAVRELAADPARARAMGAAARQYVEQHFDRAQQAARFNDLLRALATGRRPPAAHRPPPAASPDGPTPRRAETPSDVRGG